MTNVDYSRTTMSGAPQGGDPYPFVFSYSIFANVNGIGFYDLQNLNCFPLALSPGCSHNPPHQEYAFIQLAVGDLVDVSVKFQANWGTAPLYLTYSGGMLTAVPEPSTWAMLLIGFACIGGLRALVKLPVDRPGTCSDIEPASRSFVAVNVYGGRHDIKRVGG